MYYCRYVCSLVKVIQSIKDEFFIDATQRNKGNGSKTVRFVWDACRELDINALRLEVEPTNAVGLTLYRKFGFEDHGRRLMTRRIRRKK